jgi:tetratricopeptide (TPR) repeat protein
LSLSGLTEGAAHDTIARALKDLLSRNPSWLECWSELGAVQEDAGHMEEALECYCQAIRGNPMSPKAEVSTSRRADAYASRARILTARDKLEDAARDYAACLELDPEKRIARIEYSEILRRLGRYQTVATVLPAAIHHEYTVSDTFNIGRNAADLVFHKLMAYAPPADRPEPRSRSTVQSQR